MREWAPSLHSVSLSTTTYLLSPADCSLSAKQRFRPQTRLTRRNCPDRNRANPLDGTLMGNHALNRERDNHGLLIQRNPPFE